MGGEPQLCFNGVNGVDGTYGLPPMSSERLAGIIQGESNAQEAYDQRFLNELKWRVSRKNESHYGVKDGVDPAKLDEAGWGAVFTHNADPAVREALSPLLDLRRSQAGERFYLFEKSNGFRVGGDDKNKFLARQGAGPGPVDPDKVPYYLLLVGSPEEIPYRFQSQLDVQFAVGRIDFGNDPEAYASYAASVVAAETGQVRLPRRLSVFGVENDDDMATRFSTQHLVSPLLEHFGEKHPRWQVEAFLKDRASKADLTRLLGGEEAPALLFSASHGMEYPSGHPQQIPHQGALLCQDWPGPEAWKGKGAVPQDYFFAGEDLPRGANLMGLMGFFFACYGCGTPLVDEFSKQAFKNERVNIAPYAFLADLPKRMLSNPGGGALAVVGHVERAWGYSFLWPGAGAQTVVFESTFDRLLNGLPVGMALEYFNERYAELSTVLADELEEIDFGVDVDPFELAGKWTANNDARGFMVLGDPAARLPVSRDAERRPSLDLAVMAEAPATETTAAPDAPEIVKARELVSRAQDHLAALEAGAGQRQTRKPLVETVRSFLDLVDDT